MNGAMRVITHLSVARAEWLRDHAHDMTGLTHSSDPTLDYFERTASRKPHWWS